LRRGPLRKLFGRRSGPDFVADGRPVSPAIAEKAIRWGLVTPADGDLFGDPKNAQTFAPTWRNDHD
jgi:hypothetical protein